MPVKVNGMKLPWPFKSELVYAQYKVYLGDIYHAWAYRDTTGRLHTGTSSRGLEGAMQAVQMNTGEKPAYTKNVTSEVQP